jgi:hypothetical protein
MKSQDHYYHYHKCQLAGQAAIVQWCYRYLAKQLKPRQRWAARQNLNDEHLSLVTNRALCRRTPGESLVPLSIVLVESYAGPKCVARPVMGRRAKTITIGDGRF